MAAKPGLFVLATLLSILLTPFSLTRICQQLVRGENTNLLAVFAGLLFLLHPVQTIGINFIWKRSSLLVTTFIFSMLLLHVRERRRQAYRRRVIALQLLLYLCALLTKELGVIAPCLLLSFDLLHRSTLKNRRTWILYALLFTVSAAFVWFRTDFFTENINKVQRIIVDQPPLNRQQYLFLQLVNLPKYIGLMLIPRPLMLDDPAPLTSLPLLGLLLSSAMLLLSLWLAVRLRKNLIVPMAIALFWFAMLPTLGVMPLSLSMDQIRLYIPLAGFAMLAVLGINACMQKTRWRGEYILLLIVVLYAAATVQQHIHCRQQSNVWRDVSQKYPHSKIALTLLGEALVDEGNLVAAADVYGQPLFRSSGDQAARIKHLSLKLRVGADKNTILTELDKIDRSRLDARSQVSLGSAYTLAANYSEAEKIYLLVIDRRPSYLDAHLSIGSLWERVGDYQRARLAFKNALQIAPQHPFANKRLKIIETQLQKETDQ